tara:strand:+ start:393 stop:605 length:213 start_codon:yes stop_codon:yes gene_type:complete
MDELQRISEYLLDKGKVDWSLIIQGVIMELNEIYAEEEEEDIDYSEEEADALPEGIPEIQTDSNGFQSLI